MANDYSDKFILSGWALLNQKVKYSYQIAYSDPINTINSPKFLMFKS